MTEPTTDYERATVAQFHRDPTGLTVSLHSGQLVEVVEWEDSTRGRRLRCRSKSGRRKWIPVHEVASVVYYTITLRDGPVARARCGVQ